MKDSQDYRAGAIDTAQYIKRCFNCVCIPAYKDRGLTDPHCLKHDIDDVCDNILDKMREMDKSEILKEFKESGLTFYDYSKKKADELGVDMDDISKRIGKQQKKSGDKG